MDAYQAGVIELEELAERRQRLAVQGRGLRARQEELRQQAAARDQQLRLLAGVDDFCASIREALQNPSFAVQQKVLQLVVDRIVVEDEQIVIHHIVPTGPVRLQPERPASESSKNVKIDHYYRWQLILSALYKVFVSYVSHVLTG